MSGSNQSADDEHVRELDVDEAFEHWSDLAKRLGAAEPVKAWDEPQEAPGPGWESTERTAPLSPPHVETNWNEVASTLGVSIPPNSVDWDEEESGEERMEPRLPDQAFTSTTKEVVIDLANSGTSPAESVPDSWRSIWGEAEPSETPQMPQQQEQAALDRMFGADSSRVFEGEQDDRPQYFDLADEEEDEFTSEVRFAPREQPIVPPRESGDVEEQEGRRHRRGRRGQSRRRGRRPDSRGSEGREAAQRPPTSEPEKFTTGLEDADDDDFSYGQEALSDSETDDDLTVDLADDKSDSKSNRRSRNRKVASWKDAIGHIVDRNLANRDREPSDGHRRRRGGGGRRR